MKKFGAATALVSGGFTFFTSRVASEAGFDFHDANVLIIRNGMLAGDVVRPIKGRNAKVDEMSRLCRVLRVSAQETLAVGDGANDLAMLDKAGLGVAFHAKPKVAAAANARIDHGDLSALLYVQGIPKSDFVG
jgi:phosphoserine phosphatase